ncbi:MAG TPA: hypothetical protein VJA16_17790, partial [Thermoanaerobaculia bacterium]
LNVGPRGRRIRLFGAGVSSPELGSAGGQDGTAGEAHERVGTRFVRSRDDSTAGLGFAQSIDDLRSGSRTDDSEQLSLRGSAGGSSFPAPGEHLVAEIIVPLGGDRKHPAAWITATRLT